MSKQAVNNKAVSDAEKREKKVVLKKLEEMEEELKVGKILKVLFVKKEWLWVLVLTSEYSNSSWCA